ncbi:MAG: phage tail protein [Proteobacteria bacterium]|nr:phage tail protein [Pseudomonadota bacterium]
MPAAPGTTPVENRAFSAAHFALEVGGQNNGLIKSIEGGGVKVDVMTYQQGGIYDRWRQIGKPKFEDIKIQIGMSTSAPYYKWIAEFFSGNQDRRDGAILAADFYYKERARREFKFGLIREITIPALDAAGKDALYMTIAIAVESIEYKPGLNGAVIDPQAKGSEAAKYWKASDFRFNLAGFKTGSVTKIDAITLKQNIIEYHGGGSRAPTKSSSQVDFPNISFTLPESEAASLVARFNKRGASVKPAGRDLIPEGAIEYLGVDMNVLGTLSFFNAEIVNVQPDKADSGSSSIKNVKVELFTEKMTFKYTNPPT